MGEVVLIIAIISGSIMVITLGCVWMGISYVKKRDGLIKGASEREMATLQQQVADVQQEIAVLKKEVERLIKIAKGGDG